VRRGRLATPFVLAGASVLALTACGNDDSYENTARPPSPVNVAANINEQQISVSPARLGAGPIVLTVVNQSGDSQVATIEVNAVESSPARENRAGLRQSTGPINPKDIAQLRVVVQPDTTYTVKTDDDKISPARITVGRERPSAQSDIAQP
jgi:hypothetical protein